MPGESEQGLEHEILGFKSHTCLCTSHMLHVGICHKNNTSPGKAIKTF